jgi:hypothetical protein
MWKAPAFVVCACLVAAPLIGCAGNVGTSAQTPAVTPAAIAAGARLRSGSARLRHGPGAGGGSRVVAGRRYLGA